MSIAATNIIRERRTQQGVLISYTYRWESCADFSFNSRVSMARPAFCPARTAFRKASVIKFLLLSFGDVVASLDDEAEDDDDFDDEESTVLAMFETT